MFLGFLECSTDGLIDGQDYQLTFSCLALLDCGSNGGLASSHELKIYQYCL